MRFPDTSIIGILLLAIAAILTAIAGTGLEAVFGEPSTQGTEFLIQVLAVIIGFGIVYGAIAIRSYLGQQ